MTIFEKPWGSRAKAIDRLFGIATTPNKALNIANELEAHLLSREWLEYQRLLEKKSGRVRIFLAKSRLFRVLAARLAPKSSFYGLVTRVPLSLMHLSNHINHHAGYPDYTREITTNSFSLFSMPGAESKRLLVLWTGASRRPMMPLSIFLESLCHLRMDVLVLRPSKTLRYHQGVRGLGDSMAETITWISDFIFERNYNQVFVQGNSLGTYPALLSAALPKVKTVLLAGPTDPYRIDSTGFQDFIEVFEGLPQKPSITVAVGSKAERDKDVAKVFKVLFSSKTLVTDSVGHNPLWKKYKEGTLARWLGENLGIRAENG